MGKIITLIVLLALSADSSADFYAQGSLRFDNSPLVVEHQGEVKSTQGQFQRLDVGYKWRIELKNKYMFQPKREFVIFIDYSHDSVARLKGKDDIRNSNSYGLGLCFGDC